VTAVLQQLGTKVHQGSMFDFSGELEEMLKKKVPPWLPSTQSMKNTLKNKNKERNKIVSVEEQE
jgi:hypothetical protein